MSLVKIELPDQELLLTWLDYSPDTGIIKFRKRDRKWFNSDRAWKQWNTLYANEIAGNKDRQLVRLQGDRYSLNRIIYKLMTGKDVEAVTYIDHDVTNLKWSNLKAYDDISLMRHQHYKILKRNKSGEKCVIWCKNNKRWQVQIKYRSEHYYIGSYINFSEAEKEVKRYKDAINNGTFLELYNSRIKQASIDNKTTGIRNILPRPNNRYCVAIYANKKRYHIGIYNTVDEAIQVRDEAEKAAKDGTFEQYWKCLKLKRYETKRNLNKN